MTRDFALHLLKINEMKCPHCLVEFHPHETVIYLGQDVEGDWVIKRYACPNPTCKKDIYHLVNGRALRQQNGTYYIESVKRTILVRPKGTNRPPVPIEVPKHFADDYTEACVVLSDSSKASAALSRRCLQLLLREKAGIKSGDLANEIQQTIDSKQLPSHLEESIDAIRNIGNFAAHPNKSKSTGEIIDVENGEAEWNLEVLEMLFDFYFVQPEKAKNRRDSLNAKLKDLGKPDMK